MSFFSGFPFGSHFQFGSQSHEGSQPAQEVDNNRFYELLGVSKTASCDEIKKAYRRLAIKKHPDKGGDPKEFAELTHAAEILTDPDKRQVYDRYGEEGIKSGMQDSSNNVSDIFDLLMGRGGRSREGPKRTPDTAFSLKVSLEEVYSGKTSKVAITRDRVCSGCNGKGGTNVKTCSSCKGKGAVVRVMQMGPGMYSQSEGPCDACEGRGQIIEARGRCTACKGNRVVKERKTIEIYVDKGVPSKHVYTFHGESDEAPGVSAGDLLVSIEVKEHEVFQRKGADLYLEKKITLAEALTGYRFAVRHLDGTDKLIVARPGDIVKTGDLRTVEELGLPVFRSPFKHGNLFISFDVEFPAPGYFPDRSLMRLREILPPPEPMDIETRPASQHTSINFDKSQITESASRAYSDIHNEEEDDPRIKGKRVQCSGTIF